MAAKASGWHRKENTAAGRARAAQYRTPEHRAKVKEYKALREAGLASCWRCGRWIPPGAPMHAGHDDHDRTVYRGPECPPCNLKAAGRKGAIVKNLRHRPVPAARQYRPSQDW